MEFVKKNLVKIILAVVFLVGLVFAATTMFKAFAVEETVGVITKSQASGAVWTYVGMTVALLGLTTTTIVSMFNKKVSTYILLATGVLALVAFILSAVLGMDYLKSLKDTIEATKPLPNVNKAAILAHSSALANQIANIVIFACTPIVLGVKSLCKCDTK